MNKSKKYIDPSQEEAILRKYVEGNASNEEAHWLEQRALDDPFLYEAMEGLENSPEAFEAIDRVKTKIGDTSSGISNWWIAPALLTLAIIGFFMFTPSTKPQDSSVVEESTSVVVDNPMATEELNEEPVIVQRKVTDSSMTFTMKEAPKTAPAQEEVPEEVFVRRMPALEPIETTSPETIDGEIETPEERAPMVNGAPIYHVMDYKMVDYRGVRTANSWEVPFYPDLGTPASMQTKDDKTTVVFNDTKEVAYVDYLEETMEYFALGKYRKAMKRFDVILEHFPEDANGLFYGGMCARELNRHETSIALLAKSKDLEIQTFKLESEFYHAWGLVEIQETQDACNLLYEIVQGGGFYADRSQELINAICED